MNQKQTRIFLKSVLVYSILFLSMVLAIASPVSVALLLKEFNIFLLTLIGSSAMIFFLLIFVGVLVNRNELIGK